MMWGRQTLNPVFVDWDEIGPKMKMQVISGPKEDLKIRPMVNMRV